MLVETRQSEHSYPPQLSLRKENLHHDRATIEDVSLALNTVYTAVNCIPHSHSFVHFTCRPVGPSQAVMAVVGVVLALLMCGSCLLAGVWWKRR